MSPTMLGRSRGGDGILVGESAQSRQRPQIKLPQNVRYISEANMRTKTSTASLSKTTKTKHQQQTTKSIKSQNRISPPITNRLSILYVPACRCGSTLEVDSVIRSPVVDPLPQCHLKYRANISDQCVISSCCKRSCHANVTEGLQYFFLNTNVSSGS